MRGLVGSMLMSIPPAFGPRESTFLQVLPPSRVRNTPRSGFGPCAWPSAATYAMSGSCGCTRTLPMLRVFSSPRWVQVFPPSVERYTPSPCETLPRMHASPMPAYTTFGSDAATAIAPTDARLKKPSLTFRQYSPPSVVFHTPPPHDPK